MTSCIHGVVAPVVLEVIDNARALANSTAVDCLEPAKDGLDFWMYDMYALASIGETSADHNTIEMPRIRHPIVGTANKCRCAPGKPQGHLADNNQRNKLCTVVTGQQHDFCRSHN